MCGEKRFGRSPSGSRQGSPPRVRGKGTACPRPTIVTGITPACAGKRAANCRKRACSWDHPRVCGEKDDNDCGTVKFVGSPPRVRGKARRSDCKSRRQWITPACAGKSDRAARNTIAAEDHPRVCGEKSSGTACRMPSMGSPPRVRGKGRRIHNRLLRHRITPACAGKSFPFDGLSIAKRDHPRVCGEKRCGSSWKNCRLGSPPRVRGKAAAVAGEAGGARITPACAGKSPLSASGSVPSGDHPRVCGEKFLCPGLDKF